MAIHYQAEVQCDKCRFFAQTSGYSESATGAKVKCIELVQSEGWVFTNGGQYCGDCYKVLKEQHGQD